MQQPELNHTQLDRLRVIAREAATECSRMFSKWVRSDVSVSMEDLQLVPFQDVMANASNETDVSVCLYMNFDGGFQGSLLYSFPDASTKLLLDLLIRRGKTATPDDVPLGELGELEVSALNETANILGCAYLNSMSKNMGVKVIPGPPCLIRDLTFAILQSVLAQQAAVQNQALLIKVVFAQADRKMDSSFYFLPLLQTLEKKL